MYFLPPLSLSLTEQIALDEALLLDAEAGGPEVLRLWHWPAHAVVLGAAGRIEDDVEIDACQRAAVPIARRSSGGGTVLLGPGCLLYTLVLRFDRDSALGDLRASYRFILDRVLSILPTELLSRQGLSDLTASNRKFSGNSQQRKRTHLLHHGTLLYAFDSAPASRYLKAPPRQPEYRRARSHTEFLTNLPITPAAFESAMREVWQANELLHVWPAERVAQLVAEKYDLDEWVYRR